MSLTLLLRCTDLAQTHAFYDTVLGFRVTGSAEDPVTAEKDGGKLLFTDQALAQQGNPALTGTIYFTVPDVDSYYAQVKHKATITWPLQDMDYGSREFGLSDCNGYLLAFQQRR